MNVLIVDDEQLARQRLRKLITATSGYRIIGEAETGEDALRKTQASNPDVILMDIRMPGMDGMEAAQHLQSLEQPPAIIFTTAYNAYALQAFETHVVDYLLKPVRQERLEEALQHAQRLTRVQAASLHEMDEQAGGRQCICASVRGSLQLVPVAEIRYFQADQKYVTVCTADKQVLIEETLKGLEQEFAAQFVRIHRNALVAKQYISGMAKGVDGQVLVQLAGITETLEVSRRHAAEIRRLVKALQS